jgi:hypothetical protein
MLALLSTACPKPSQSQLDKAANASSAIASRYVETVDFVITLYSSKVISLEIKDKIMGALVAFGESGKKFNDLLKTYSIQFKNGIVPPDIWSVISTNFDTLSRDFLKLLDFLPQAAGLSSNKAFRAISAAVVALAQVLSQTGVIPDSRYHHLQKEAAHYGLA